MVLGDREAEMRREKVAHIVSLVLQANLEKSRKRL